MHPLSAFTPLLVSYGEGDASDGDTVEGEGVDGGAEAKTRDKDSEIFDERTNTINTRPSGV